MRFTANWYPINQLKEESRYQSPRVLSQRRTPPLEDSQAGKKPASRIVTRMRIKFNKPPSKRNYIHFKKQNESVPYFYTVRHHRLVLSFFYPFA